jgi:colicin import membrane protein
VDEHRKQAHEHEAAARAMAHELERRQTELAQSSAQVKRLEEQLEKLGAREAQLQADAIARSQQMRHSLDASEQAQGDAHATIATLRLELADMQRHKERADAADAKVREQASEIMDLQLQMRGQADLARVQTDDEKASLQRQYENERREFVSHLEKAEGSIQTLRSELENGQKAHAELMSKVFAQESLQASLSSQLIDANSQAAQARSAQDLARCEIESLQKQRQEDLAMMEALNADLRQLRVEENSWKRIERNKIIAQLESLEHENQSLKARLAEVSARNAGLESHLLQARQLGSKQDGLLHHAEPTTNEVAVQEGSVASTSDKGRGGGLLGMGWF